MYSLFLTLWLDETIDISIKYLFKIKQTASVHNKQKVLRTLLLTTKENITSHDEKPNSHIDGAAKCSFLGWALANNFSLTSKN